MNRPEDMDSVIFLLSAAAAAGGEVTDMAVKRCRRYNRYTVSLAMSFVDSLCSNPEARQRLATIATACGFEPIPAPPAPSERVVQ